MSISVGLSSQLSSNSKATSKNHNLVARLRDVPQPIALTSALAQGYRLALCDSSVTFPFQLTPELLHRASVFSRLPLFNRPTAIFNYLHDNIEYGISRREHGKKYSMGAEVWKNKQGVCGEMSYLYVSMARFAGLLSNYVSVFIDVNGEEVSHACACVQLAKDSQMRCVDIAYHSDNIVHRKWAVISDERAWELFREWR